MIIELHLEASAELAAAADWYQRNDHQGFAEDFLESIDKALEQIAEMPHTWPPCHGLVVMVSRASFRPSIDSSFASSPM